MWQWISRANLWRRSSPALEDRESGPRSKKRWFLLSFAIALALLTALPYVWSFDVDTWDTINFTADPFSTTVGFIGAPSGPGTNTVGGDHRYQNIVGFFEPTLPGNSFDDTVSGLVQVPGLDPSTFASRGNVLPGFPLACCAPVRGFGVDGDFYFPFTDQGDDLNKMAAIPWGGGPASVTIIDPLQIAISTLFARFSEGFAFITFDFNDVAHIYSGSDPTLLVETGTLPAANPAFTSGHQVLGGDLTWSHTCLVNMPPRTNPAFSTWTLHNIFPGTGVDDGSTLITTADFSAPGGFYRTAVTAVPFDINSQPTPVCAGAVPDPGGDSLTVFAAVTQASGPPTNMQTVDLAGVLPGTPMVGAVDSVVYGITPSADGSRCFMCNFGDLSDSPFCMVMSGPPFVTHANRLDDDGRSGAVPSSGRIPVVVYQPKSLRPETVGGDDGFIFHPLVNDSAEQGLVLPSTDVVYGAIDVPFFFHNFESGDFRFWSDVVGAAGG